MNESAYLGTEKTGKLLFKFAMPCIFGLIIQSLYNIVDQIFVGQGIGMIGNAATGIIFPLTMIGLGFGVFFGDGVATTVSVALGRGEGRNVHKAVGTSLTVALLVGIIYTIIYYIAGDKLLYFVGATENNIEMTRQYGAVIFMMMPIFIVQTTYATIIGQLLSFIIYALYFGRVKNFKLQKDSFIPKFSVLKRIMALGSSSLLTQLAVVVVTVVNNILLVTYGAASSYGSDVSLAAFVVIMKLFQIVLCIAIGIAAGGQPIVGYNYGANKFDRVKEILNKMLLWTFVSCGICWALFQIFPTFFVELFGSDNASYIVVATKCLRIYLMFLVFACLSKVCAIFLQSIGEARLAAPLSVFRDIVLIASSVVLARIYGIDGIFYAAPFTDIITTMLTVVLMVKVVTSMGTITKQVISSTTDKLTTEDRENVLSNLIKPSKTGIIIAISREHGTAGKRIGEEVAKRLNIPFYCTEIMQIASAESGMSDVFIRDINTNENTAFGGYYMSSSAVQQAMTAQAKAINRIADAGSCVMVGRACSYVLKERKNVVKVFIHAPFEYKVDKVIEMYHDTKDKAEAFVKKSDNARAMYYKSVSGHEWADSDQYDLSINANIGIEKVANVICSYIENM